jgi:hypothetical protein
MPSVESIAAPWLDGRPSIHSLVLDALAARGSHEEVPLKLKLPPTRLGQLGFGPGAFDSLAGRPDKSPRQTKARRRVAAITNALRRPSADAMAHLYALLQDGETIATVDRVLADLSAEIGEQRPQLAVLARRLVKEAPDIEPVKAGLALLGLSGTDADAALVSTVGRYEECTIYAVIALRKLLADAEPAIWSLARNVHGWGRIVDGALHALLQGLRRFPGIGGDLVLVGLRARVIGTRNMAISVLQQWDRDKWPANAQLALRRAVEQEVADSVREGQETLLRGSRS